MSASLAFAVSFEAEAFYHVICKSVAPEYLFRSDDNKNFFLQRYKDYILPYTKLLSYCMFNNHAHFLVQIKSCNAITESLEAQLFSVLTKTQREWLASSEKEITISTLIQRQYNSFCTSYTQAYNKLFDRKGNLFSSPFRRIRIETEEHLTQAIIYIHANVYKHQLTKDFQNYKWSSYKAILSDKQTSIEREMVLQWFGGKKRFEDCHNLQADYYYAEDFFE